MNNYTLHEQAQELSDSSTAYSLARALLSLQEKYDRLIQLADTMRLEIEVREETLAEYQRIYGVLDQSDYLRR